MKKGIRALFDEKLWKFLLVGILNTLVGNGLMFVLYHATPMGYWASSALSYLLASIMSYFLNRYFTFKFQGKGIRPAVRFAINIAVCYVLAYGLARPLATMLLNGQSENVRDTVAMLVGMVLFTGLNYLGQRMFAFRERDLGLRNQSWKQGTSGMVYAFVIPVAAMIVAFAVQGIYPFGDRQALAHDMWHQYYPFFVDFRRKLLDGSSVIYSQTSGMGGSYLGMYAYYLASPLNFLSALIPENFLLDFYTLLLLFKIGLAGFTFAVFLRRTFHQRDLSVVPFSVGYALCSFIMGYYWNTMWLDAIVLLPLVTSGAISLLRDKRWRLYVVSLALTVWCNYYVAFFICIFQVFVFLGYVIAYWDGFENFFLRFMRMLGCSILGVGMAAVLLIPTYMGLQNTYSAINKFPTGLALNIASENTWLGVLQGLRDIFSNQLVGTTPTAMTGLPNIYCGVFAVFLATMYCMNGKIRLRERIGACVLLLFFAASFLFRQLDYLWHGMHFPNMLPYRFSFLFSFVVLTMAFRVYTRLEHAKFYQAILAFVVLLGICTCGFFRGAQWWQLVLTAAVGIGLLTVLVLFCKGKISKQVVLAVILTLSIAEGTATAILGVDEAGTSTRSTYPKSGEDVSEVISQLQELEKEIVDQPRTEITNYQTLNDAPLLGYDGVSIFSSTCSKNISDFTLHLGLASWPASNRYEYMQSSPFTNLLLNVKYLIDRDGNYLDPLFTDPVAEQGGVKGYQVNSYLPMGYVMREEILDYDVNGTRPFPMTVQNEIFKMATGLNDTLYSPLYPVEMTCAEQHEIPEKSSKNVYYYHAKDMTEDPKVTYRYVMQEDTMLCLYFQSKDVTDLDVDVNGERLCRRNVKVGSILCLGYHSKGDTITISFTGKAGTDGKVNLQACRFDPVVFQKGRKVLAQSVLHAEVAAEGKLSGTIQVEEAGVFYTSIPYEPGWTAKLDGTEVEITPVGDAFIAFKIPQGEHTVELTFTQPGLAVGLGISVVCVLLFAILCLTLHRKQMPVPPPSAQETFSFQEAPADMKPLEELLKEDSPWEEQQSQPPENQMPPLKLDDESSSQ